MDEWSKIAVFFPQQELSDIFETMWLSGILKSATGTSEKLNVFWEFVQHSRQISPVQVACEYAGALAKVKEMGYDELLACKALNITHGNVLTATELIEFGFV